MADFVGTTGNDVQDGSSDADNFDYSQGGKDTLNGLEGDDIFIMGAELNVTDHIDGGADNDTVVLDGDYNILLRPATITNVETLRLTRGHDYTISTNDGNVADDATMTIDGSALRKNDTLVFDGKLEKAGSLHIIGGASADTLGGGAGNDTIDAGGGNDTVDGAGGNDQIAGGNGNDTLTGGDGEDTVYGGTGADVIYGGAGANTLFGEDGDDTLTAGEDADELTGGLGHDVMSGGSGAAADDFIFGAVAESTGVDCDWITDFDTAVDTIDVTPDVTGVDAVIAGGKLSLAKFEQKLAQAADDTHLAAGHAVVFDPDKGDLKDHIYVVIDANGVAGYQAGEDYVIDMTGGTALEALGLGNFL